MSELEVFGVLEGTDKSSAIAWSWDYLRHYDDLLSSFRDKKINLLEIGCSSGASLRMWKRYFSQATLVGIDIDERCRALAEDRVVVRIGSQDDPSFLHQVASEYPPTIIIDDGSHIAHHMITSFETLFPVLAAGGIYIFEDLAFHFTEGRPYLGAEVHKGLSPITIYEYLSQFIQSRAAEVCAPEASWGFQRYAHENIDDIHVFGGVIAFKKRAPLDVSRHVELFGQHLSYDSPPSHVVNHALFALKHGVMLETALQQLEFAIRHDAEHAELHVTRLEVLKALGRSEPASS